MLCPTSNLHEPRYIDNNVFDKQNKSQYTLPCGTPVYIAIYLPSDIITPTRQAAIIHENTF